jgi:hypothetical protein
MKARSWVLRKNLAMSADEPTTAGKEPNQSDMSDPYRAESSCRERCGSGPIRFGLPITGHGRGPGGSLYLLEHRQRPRRAAATRKSTTGRKELHWSSSSIRTYMEVLAGTLMK